MLPTNNNKRKLQKFIKKEKRKSSAFLERQKQNSKSWSQNFVSVSLKSFNLPSLLLFSLH